MATKVSADPASVTFGSESANTELIDAASYPRDFPAPRFNKAEEP
jgi:hypothetical protein